MRTRLVAPPAATDSGADLKGELPSPEPGGAFSITLIEINLEGCPTAAIGDQENEYMKALGKAKKFRVIGDRLEILETAGDATLVFIKQEALPENPIELAGTQWRLLAEGDWGRRRARGYPCLPGRLSSRWHCRLSGLPCNVRGIRGANWLSADVDGSILLPIVLR